MSASSTQERSWIVDFLSMLLLAFCIGVTTSVVLGAAVVLMAGEARGAEGAQVIETAPMTPFDAPRAGGPLRYIVFADAIEDRAPS